MNNIPKARQKDIVVQDTKDEVLVYDLITNKAYCLNETSKMVWQLCDGKNTVVDIADKLTRHFKKSINEDFIYLAMSQLDKDGLLETETSNEFKSNFAKVSRREMIEKAAFASMVALPIVSSVIAPKAASAASNPCPPPTQPCFENVFDPGSGTCIERPLNCDDGDACTSDRCDPVNNVCVYTPIPGCGT